MMPSSSGTRKKLANKPSSTATRVGAEYARDGTTCQSGIQILLSPPVSAACNTGIQTAIKNSMNYPSGALTFPASFPLSCQCDDATATNPSPITCGNSCAAAGRPAPNRVFIRISASQSFTPFVTLWTAPTTLNGVADVRIQ